MVKDLIFKIDVDGVLRDSFQAMCDLYNHEFEDYLDFGSDNMMTVEDIKDYNVDVSFPFIKEKLGIPAKEFFFHIHAKEVFYDAKLYPGAADALKMLHDNGAIIEICSYQPTKEGRKYTLKFLDDNDFYFDGVHFTHDKWKVSSDWMIDDCIDFLNDKRETSQKICIDRPFNRNYECIRYKSIYEAIRQMIKYL